MIPSPFPRTSSSATPRSSVSSRSPRSQARSAEWPDRCALVFGLPRELASDIRAVAQELAIGVAEPAHLQAACRALAQYPGALLLLSPSLKPWDRDVVLDHAARARAEVVFVDRPTPEDARSGVLRRELERWAKKRR